MTEIRSTLPLHADDYPDDVRQLREAMSEIAYLCGMTVGCEEPELFAAWMEMADAAVDAGYGAIKAGGARLLPADRQLVVTRVIMRFQEQCACLRPLLSNPKVTWPLDEVNAVLPLLAQEANVVAEELMAAVIVTSNRDGICPSGTGPAREGSDDEHEPQPPALTKSCRVVLVAMQSFDPRHLVGPQEIAERIEPTDRLSERTIRDAVAWLCQHDLAERPQGKRSGARLTTRGRRLVPKITD